MLEKPDILTDDEIQSLKHGMNRKWLRFIEELPACKDNQTQAAINAGYPKRSASQQSSRIMTNHKVTQLVKHQRALLALKLDMDSTDVLRELACVGFSNIIDYLTYEDNAIVLKSSEELTREQTAAILSIKSTDTQWGTTVELKLHPKTPALVNIGTYFGMFDKQGDKGKPLDGRTLEEIRAARARAEKALREAVGKE